jgi:mRNA interferase RelE/StbE
MASYRIVFKKSVAKDLRPIPNTDVQRILKRIEGLAEDPRPAGTMKLSGDEKYRIRQGNYCILYTIEDDFITVTIVKVGHRRDVYR